MHRFRAIALLILAVVVASACSDSNPTSSGTLAVATAIPAPTPEGERVDGFAPAFDEGVVIVGYGVGETIQLRLRPGVDQGVTAEIPGDAVGLNGLGETFVTPDDKTWWFVRWENTQGWIEPGAAYLGAPSDVTADVSQGLSATSYASAADLVADVTQYFFADSDDRSVVVGVGPPTAGGQSVTVADVLRSDRGDRQIGERLAITTSNADGNFTLVSVEQRPLCGEGLTDSGSCN